MANEVTTKPERPLSKNMEAFAVAWVELGIGLDAYRRAYPLSKMTDQQCQIEAAKLISDPRISRRIIAMRKPAAEHATMTAAEWLAHEIDVGYADPTELVKYRVLNCRYCNGIDHKYQWRNLAEYADAVHQTIEAEKRRAKADTKGEGQPIPLPSAEGGYGFRRNLPVQPDCPACEGEGEREVFLEDSAKLSRQAKALLAGYKYTKYGIEVMMHDQTAARVNVGKFLGVLVDRTKHEGSLGIAAAPLSITPEQAAEIAKRLMGEI